jgi:hypothetical protein
MDFLKIFNVVKILVYENRKNKLKLKADFPPIHFSQKLTKVILAKVISRFLVPVDKKALKNKVK